jgi:hypothetical protein
MKPRWFFLASLAVVVALIATSFLPTHRRDIAVLDRLAPRIERTQTLAPETRDAIMRLVDRARVSTGDARSDQQRSATIARVTSAIRDRGGDPALSGTVGQAASAR